MKSQALFSSNDKSKELKCRLLQFLWRFKGYYNKPQQDKQRLTACENSTFALSDQTFLFKAIIVDTEAESCLFALDNWYILLHHDSDNESEIRKFVVLL